MLLRRLFFSAFLVGAALAISAFTFALTENPFHSFPETIELQSLPLSPISQSQTLYEKYGGYPTVKRIVDDTSAALTVDPIMAPYLLGLGPLSHTPDKLLSCLDQQFSALLGGPYSYPSTSHFRSAPEEGYACSEMQMLQTGLNISVEAFDRFIVILADVLKQNGVEAQDVDTIARALAGLRNDVVER